MQLDPENAESYQIQGGILAALQRSDEAQRSYEKALKLDPESVGAHLGLGILCSDQDDVQQARRAFDQAAEQRPDRPLWRLRHLGLCSVVFESPEAITEYRASLEAELDQALADPPPFDWPHAL